MEANTLFIKHLQSIRQRPSMYCCDNLNDTIFTVFGMDLMIDKSNFDKDFRVWLCSEKLKFQSAVWWGGLVQEYLEKEKVEPQNQVVAFYDNLFEFLENKTTPQSPE